MEEKFKEIIKNSRASIEKKDLEILLPIIASIKPTRVLEIGAWKGFSAEVWIKAFEPESFLTIEKDSKEIRESYIEGLRYQYWYSCDSHDPKVIPDIKNYYPEGFDFLFIDGDHSFEGVMQDFETYVPLVREGGIIALHDIRYHVDKTEEVDIFWFGIRDKYPYVEIKARLQSTGMGVLFV